MERAHAAYGKLRRELLTHQDLELIRERRWESSFSIKRGVAGSANYRAVKCLHAHAAHYLSECAGSADNAVGHWVTKEVERRWQEELCGEEVGGPEPCSNQSFHLEIGNSGKFQKG
jgi:hypothetical protein